MDHKDFCNHTRIKLIASAIGHQQCTKTAANIIQLPGTDRVIAIGTPAEVRGLLGAAPLTAPAPLTDELQDQLTGAMYALRHIAAGGDDPAKCAQSALDVIERLHSHAEAIEQRVELDDSDFYPPRALLKREDWNPATRKPHVKQIAEAEAAPAPQQSELTDERIAELARQEGDEDTHGFIFNKDGRFSVISFARAIEREVLAKAASAAPVQTAEPKRIPDMLTVEAIQGAIAFGRMGINPPPSPDHWGNEFWQIGRQLAKLSETSAWDNVTPVDVAAPVQAEQAQADEILALHRQLAAEKLRADQGWERAEAKSKECVEIRERLAALPAQAEQAAAVRAATLEEAAKLIDTKVYNYQDEFGRYDHTTGVTEYPGNGAEWICEMEELAEEIRALRTASNADEAQTQAARDVLDERRRQIETEGWTPRHDDKYRMSELSTAAACYALTDNVDMRADVPQIWPWPADWWKPTTERRNLVKAGALILAEIERLDRTQSTGQTSNDTGALGDTGGTE